MVALLATGCVPNREALVMADAPADRAQHAQLWGDSEGTTFVWFTNVDGKPMPQGFARDVYALTLAPGKHAIDFRIRDSSSHSDKDRGWHADFDRAFEFEAGHTYVLHYDAKQDKMRLQSRDYWVHAWIEDLGVGVPCKYIERDLRSDGAAPLKLACGAAIDAPVMGAAAEAELAQ